ncbi:MAG: TlpA disulfide reductase family protein [Pseudomonadota bacterium]
MRSSTKGLLFALLLSIGLPTLAAAEEIVLDPARKAALLALPSIDGPSLSAADLEDRVVVVNFFASWCPPCHPEFDNLIQLDRDYRARGVTVVSVNIFEDFFGEDGGLRLRGFLAGKAPPFPVLGDGETVAEAFGEVTRIPTLLVFDREGQPSLHFVHAEGSKKTHASLDEIKAAVESVL